MNIEKYLSEHIEPEALSGCWLWTGSVTHDGYPYFRENKKNRYAHRVVYEREISPIPDGLTLDHLCRVRSCVNPKHMEPVTLQENIARGDYGWRGRLTHCKHGHLLSGENLIYRPHGGRNGGPKRDCRECGRISARKYYAKKKQGA